MVVERHRQSITAKIVVAAALVQNATGELLLVRKGGTEIGDRSSRADHHAGGPLPIAGGLLLPFLRHRGRLDFIRT
jgi:hypothetical protein